MIQFSWTCRKSLNNLNSLFSLTSTIPHTSPYPEYPTTTKHPSTDCNTQSVPCYTSSRSFHTALQTPTNPLLSLLNVVSPSLGELDMSWGRWKRNNFGPETRSPEQCRIAKRGLFHMGSPIFSLNSVKLKKKQFEFFWSVEFLAAKVSRSLMCRRWYFFRGCNW